MPVWAKDFTQRRLSQSLDYLQADSLFLQVLQEGRYKGPEALSTVFQDAGVDLEKPIITSCGTGVTASVLALALHQVAPSTQVKPSYLHSSGMQRAADMYVARGLRWLPELDNVLHKKALVGLGSHGGK